MKMQANENPPAEQQKSDSEYVAVQGLDRKTVELKRQYEAEVEAKVASDYSHIVWAYAVIWILFAGYGLFLWKRNRALESDLATLKDKLR